MKRFVWLAVMLVACGSKEEKKSDDVKDMVDDASVDWARKQVPEIEKLLASSDPGAASSNCAVIKPDMAKVQKADKKLAAQLEKLCGHDLHLRSLTVFVEKAEAARKVAPDDKFLMECSSWDIYAKHVPADDAELPKLKARYDAACPPRK
jgi:hypothetical protein